MNLTKKPKFSKKNFALSKTQTSDKERNKKRIARLRSRIPIFPVTLKGDEVCCKDCGLTFNRKSIMRHHVLKHGGLKKTKQNWKDLVTKKRPILRTTIRLDSKDTVILK